MDAFDESIHILNTVEHCTCSKLTTETLEGMKSAQLIDTDTTSNDVVMLSSLVTLN